MDLKHSPQAAFHQASRAGCLRRWYAGPQGLRVHAALRRQLDISCRPRFGDAWLEVGPLNLLRPEWTGPAQVLHAGLQSQRLRAQAAFLPFPPETFSCVLLTHALRDPDDDAAVIAEAVRVMAPEGHLFLLESGCCSSSGRWSVRSAVPVGLRRRRLRRLLEAAGLGLRRQLAFTVLPTALPRSWHRRLSRLDAAVSPWLPLLGTCVLTVARRRDLIPLARVAARPRWSRGAVRAGGRSQWA
jgi:SAM-dependent methyltransferase